MMRYALFMIVSACFALTSVANAAAAENDLEILRERILAPMFEERVDSDAVKALVASQNPDGSFPDVDYEHTAGGNWATMKHVTHIYKLARAFRSPKSPLKNNSACKNALSKGLDYWNEKDFINSNWWWNQIGVPGRMARILLLFDEELSPAQRSKGIEILKRAKIRMTGANLVDVAFITLMRGVLEKDIETVQYAVDSITGEIKITTKEGVQPDYSFHQHGALLYNHGYGAVFSTKCGELAELVVGTSFAFPPEKINLLTDFILQGTRWMIRKSTRDYGATGRGLTREAGNSGSAAYLGGIVDTMLKIPTGHESELIALREQVDGKRDCSVTGNKYFWRGGIMTHHRKGYYISARMYSERLFNTDGSHNGEGLLSHYLGDGCTYIMQSGMEYHNIFPAWNWRKIPGTTVELREDFPGKVNIMGTGSWAGGVSDGRYGVTSFDFKRDSLNAKKAWFFFDDIVVCLGSGISSNSGDSVITTLNQCYLNGDVTVSSGRASEILDSGEHSIYNAGWVLHDSIVYLFFDNPQVQITNRKESGSWQKISSQRSADPVEKDIFTMWFDHGMRPQDGSYAYGIMPGIDSMKAEAFYADKPVHIDNNTTSIQQVSDPRNGISGIVFFEAGTAKLPGGGTVTVDRPCLALVTEQPHGFDVSIADPENKSATVTVKLTTGGGASKTVDFELPKGMYAGKTLTRRIVLK